MKNKKRGRPPIDNARTARLPNVRVTESQLEGYRKAASKAGQTFADWVRKVLDIAAK